MMLLRGVTHRETAKQVMVTHHTENGGKEHFISVYEPNPAGGELAGKRILTLVLSPSQAEELKRHL